MSNCRPLCALSCTVALLWLGPVAAQPAASSSETNAALKYWQAFGQLPKLDQEQEKILIEWNKAPLDGATHRLIDAGKDSLTYLQRGSKLARCYWAMDYDDGINMLMPHLEKARTLSRLACLRARDEFERGNVPAALDDIGAVFVLGRHVGVDPIMISILVDFAIEQSAIDAVAPYLPKLSAQELKTLAMRVDALPSAATFPQSLLTEKEFFVGWLIKRIKAAEEQKKGAWLDEIRWFFNTDKESRETIKALDPKSPAKLIALLEGLSPYYQQIDKMLASPGDDFAARWAAFRAKAKAENPLAGLALPALDKVVAAEDRAKARLALFKAAIAVAQSGPDALKNYPDPFGKGPFEYRALPQGFELKSKLIYKDEPVTLTAGK